MTMILLTAMLDTRELDWIEQGLTSKLADGTRESNVA